MTAIKLDAQAVEEVHKQMSRYGQEHLGHLYGEDFPDFARLLSSVETVVMGGLMRVCLIGLTGAELANSLRDLPQERTMEVAAKSLAYQNFVEMAYYGYLLGKRAAEIEQLERLAGSGSESAR